MYYYQVLIILFLHGFSHVFGFFNFRLENLFKISDSYNKTALRDSSMYYIEQPTDHFNQSDQRSFKMRYHKDLKFWKPGGPILVKINGESSMPEYGRLNKDGNEDLIVEIIKEIGAAYFSIEHRYYGESKPFEDPTVENLKYLNSQQALADVAHLLQTLKASNEFTDSKVLIVGGSYAGNLAAWMKVMYPNEVDAVLASSAPVLAKKNFYEYFDIVTDTLRDYGFYYHCPALVRKKFERLQNLLRTPEGIEEFKKIYGVCDNVNMSIPMNQQMFFVLETWFYADLVQYGTPKSVLLFCRNQPLNPLQLQNIFPFIRDDRFGCNSFEYDSMIKKMYKKNGAMWLWLYQTCTEFGYFQTTDSTLQSFGKGSISLEFYLMTCKVIFGEQFDEQRVDQGIKNTNGMYEGLSPNVENVLFVNGDMDPWHKLSILRDLADNVPAIFILGSSHCHDWARRTPDEGANVEEARIKIKNILKKWILKD